MPKPCPRSSGRTLRAGTAGLSLVLAVAWLVGVAGAAVAHIGPPGGCTGVNAGPVRPPVRGDSGSTRGVTTSSESRGAGIPAGSVVTNTNDNKSVISADGSTVAFTSSFFNLVPGGTDGKETQIYAKDL